MNFLVKSYPALGEKVVRVQDKMSQLGRTHGQKIVDVKDAVTETVTKYTALTLESGKTAYQMAKGPAKKISVAVVKVKEVVSNMIQVLLRMWREWSRKTEAITAAPEVVPEPAVKAEEPAVPEVKAEEPAVPEVNAEEPEVPEVKAEEPEVPEFKSQERKVTVTNEEPVVSDVETSKIEEAIVAELENAIYTKEPEKPEVVEVPQIKMTPKKDESRLQYYPPRFSRILKKVESVVEPKPGN